MIKILVAIDGSDHSRKACNIAGALAKQHSASLLLLHVVTTKEPSREARHAVEVEYSEELVKRCHFIKEFEAASGSTDLAKLISTGGGEISSIINSIFGNEILNRSLSSIHDFGLKDVSTKLAYGEPADQILDLVENDKFDSLVIGCRGMGRLQGLLLGSVSQSVAYRANCSVIMVK